MDKKFEVELTKVEKVLDKVDNDLLRQGLRSDFTVFFKNMDKTFEIYNVCLEELTGQLYLMDLAFHSRVIRKLFHNYKHQLHNIMKYQLTLQKELNLKYQEEKKMKVEIERLELERQKERERNTENKLKNLGHETDLMDDERKKDLKLQGLDQEKKRLLAEGERVADDYENNQDKELMAKLDALLNENSLKSGDGANVKAALLKILSDLEAQKTKLDSIESGQYKTDAELSELQKKARSYVEKDMQTEMEYVPQSQLNEYVKKFNELMKKHEEASEQSGNLDGLYKDLEDQLQKAKQESTEKDETLAYYEELVSTEKNRSNELEEKIIKLEEQNTKYIMDADKDEDKILNFELEVDTLKKKISKLEEEISSLNNQSPNGGASNANKDVQNDDDEEDDGKISKTEMIERIRDLEVEKEALEQDLDEVRDKYDKLLKADGNIDEHTQGMLKELESDVKTALEEAQKLQGLYDNEVAQHKITKKLLKEKNTEFDELHKKAHSIQEQLDKAHYIIKKASEGGDSYLDDGEIEEEGSDLEAEAGSDPKNQTGQISRIKTEAADDNDQRLDIGMKTDQNFTSNKSSKKRRRKLKKINIKMLDKEIEAFLGDYEANKITFAKSLQTEELEPITYLIAKKEDLLHKPLNYEEINDAMDLLACLLGYDGLEQMIDERRPQVEAKAEEEDDISIPKRKKWKAKLKKKDRPDMDLDEDRVERKVINLRPKKTVPRRPKAQEPSEDEESDEETEFDPNLYPRMPNYRDRSKEKAIQKSRSPEKRYDPYYEDFSDLAQSRRIVPKKKHQNTMQEEEEFRRNLSEEDERGGSFSRAKVEKEIVLFRMYMNIKRRYFKDPERFLKVFKIYFGRDPPKVNVKANADAGEFVFSYNEFKEYYGALMHIHDRCGDNCIHLSRWYRKMGINEKYKGKKYLVLRNQVIDKLPKSKPKRKNSLERLVRKYYKYY